MMLFLLWFSFFGGPVSWSLHLLMSYPLVHFVCATGGETLLHTITTVTGATSLGAAAAGWWLLRDPDTVVSARGERAIARAQFMARSGLYAGAFFFLVILAEGLPVFLQHPCD